MRLQRRHLWYAAGVVAAAWLAFRLLRPETIAVEVAPATVGPLLVTVGDEGQTRVRHRHIVTAPVPGRLERITLEVGDAVAAGAVVARLAPLPLDARSRSQAEAALEASRDLERRSVAAVEQARTALEQARQDRARAEQLAAGGGIARADLERLRLNEQARQREVEAAEAGARAAAHDVQSARSALMASGTAAGARSAAADLPGRRTRARDSRAERADGTGRRVTAGGRRPVGSRDRRGSAVHRRGESLGRAAHARDGVGRGFDARRKGPLVEPAGFTKVSALGVEEQRVNVVGDFVTVPARLGDRFRLDVRLVLWEGDSVLKVPASALFRRGDRWALFAVEDGRAREREVTVGHESSTEAEIAAGVRRGEWSSGTPPTAFATARR